MFYFIFIIILLSNYFVCYQNSIINNFIINHKLNYLKKYLNDDKLNDIEKSIIINIIKNDPIIFNKIYTNIKNNKLNYKDISESVLIISKKIIEYNNENNLTYVNKLNIIKFIIDKSLILLNINSH
jgi:hypothetical protein